MRPSNRRLEQNMKNRCIFTSISIVMCRRTICLCLGSVNIISCWLLGAAVNRVLCCMTTGFIFWLRATGMVLINCFSSGADNRGPPALLRIFIESVSKCTCCSNLLDSHQRNKNYEPHRRAVRTYTIVVIL